MSGDARFFLYKIFVFFKFWYIILFTMNNFSSYKFRLILANVFCILLVSGIVAFIGSRGIEKSSINSFSERGTVIMERVAETINLKEYKRIAQSLDEKDPYYDQLNKELFEIKETFKCKFLYLMNQVEGTRFVYVCDGTNLIAEAGDDFSPIGTEEDIESYGQAPFDSMEKRIFTTSGIEEQDGWGKMITAYYPLSDEKGDPMGFIGADFEVNKLQSDIRDSIVTTIIFTVIGAIVAAMVFSLFLWSFFKNMDKVVLRMEQISGGGSDLTARIEVKGDNELGQLSAACNSVIETIQEMVKTVSTSVNDLSFNSTEIAEESKQMISMLGEAESDIGLIENKAKEQSALVDTLNKKVEEFRNAINMFRQRVEQQGEAVNHSSSAIEQITANIDSADQNISRISAEYAVIVNDTNTNLTNQKNLSEQIEKIQVMAQNLFEANKIITNIASQTNLLAMNAAIEAAHAGEAGSGFSVVAEEIRNLAETSAKQTVNIKGIVNDIEKAVGAMVNSSNASEKAFEQLGAKVGSLQQSVSEIQNGMKEQASGAKEILEMMRVLNHASNEMFDASDKMTSETESISSSMGAISGSSNEILSSTGHTFDKLKQIKVFAEESAGTSENNNQLAGNVSSLVSSYKVE